MKRHDDLCSAPSCERRRIYSNGLCPKHHSRLTRLGSIEDPTPRPSLRERFLSFVTPEPFSGCWLWTGAVDRRGYGVIHVTGGIDRAHRVGYALFVREPGAAWCLHKCDTPLCVNPAHIFLGTARDNVLDMIAKGREKHPSALNPVQVQQIRADYANGDVTYSQLGKQYGVDGTCIYKIVRRKRWRKLPC